MSSALDKMAYLRAQSQWFVFGTPCPADETESWDKHNEKVLSNITLHVSPSIQTTIADLTTVKEVWDHLKENYGTPSISSAYAKLSWLLTMSIPAGSHPTPAITKMLSHFTYLKDTSFKFPTNVQTLPSEVKTLKPDGIVKVVTLLFEQKGASHGSDSKAPQANKLSTVKHKQVDPKFAQQQQKVPIIDPCALAHTPGATKYNPPAFDNTIKAFDLAHHLGVEPFCQTICTLDSVISTASAKLDQPEASPLSFKCHHLEEHISMDIEEDTASLGDDKEPFIYENFIDDEFDEINKMVLDCYNMVLMNLGVEASLFRQVPSACCHAPNMFGTVNMEHTIDSRLSWSK
ncbi:hypothetical protein SCLCIDRAFT_25962 [Scleroderma citrinum Foug A]|uniref:Uncharacterized protein n=1 Tax=Scleroderma citrinum Foug A TaxID=1036808 RepID=A0A0C3DKW7_9AGAM|nr:hypothetical protein SCLCIDRAFT_25962 [Scleroderma citrinum Foug A]